MIARNTLMMIHTGPECSFAYRMQHTEDRENGSLAMKAIEQATNVSPNQT